MSTDRHVARIRDLDEAHVGKFVGVWRRRDDDRRLRLDISNSDGPAPAGAD
jgi:hypothetical protein